MTAFTHRALRFLIAPALALALAGCGGDDFGEPLTFERPETAVDYEIILDGAPTEEIAALLESSLLIYRRQEDGAGSRALLRRRAQGDVDTVKKILRSYGYYEAMAEVQVLDPPAGEESGEGEAPDPGAEGETVPDQALVRMTVIPGRPFTLAGHRFQIVDFGEGGAPPLPGAAELGSPIGQPAAAQAILDAETAAVSALRGAGRPYAERRDRSATADLEIAELEVETTIAAGPAYVFGPLGFEGLEDVDEAYLLTYLPWEEGEVIDPALLVAYQRALLGTDLFATGAVRLPDTPPDAEAAPVTATLSERPFRTVTGGVRYSTDAGPAVRAGYEHRNLFGSNETLNAEALAGLEEQRLEFRYRKPQYLRSGQDLIGGVAFRRMEDDAFDELAVTATLGLERDLGDGLVVGAGGLIELSQIDDDGEEQTFALVGLPLFASLDRSDDFLNPTTGFRLRSDVIPFVGAAEEDTPIFLSLDTSGSAYFDLTGEKLYILAGRARLGSIIAGDVESVPANRRLYSGGGGSVRGYAERFIGPLDADGDPEGGLSALELGAELRARVYGDLGVALFVEGGSVSEEVAPTFSEGMQVAAGVGARYYSPVGPIRVDVGVPVNGRDEDDAFQVYISIGQAF